ncbi:hypothetical protein KBC70_01655 [Candidatus Woesebacteria bacterium]|nr:hypothetical protein [Candidatus Woesebacteria bacterium]
MPVSRTIAHIFVLIFVLTLAFLVSLTPIKNWYVEISAVLMIVYIVLRRLMAQSQLAAHHRGLIYASIFAFIATYTVLSSGALQSPYFFLVYFLIFSLSILLDPIVSLVTAIALMFLFAWHMSVDFSTASIMPLISLPFLVPFAVFLGKEHQDLVEVQRAKDEEKSNTFLFLSVVIKGHLNSLHDIVMNFKGDHDLLSMSKILKRTRKLIDDFEARNL